MDRDYPYDDRIPDLLTITDLQRRVNELADRLRGDPRKITETEWSKLRILLDDTFRTLRTLEEGETPRPAEAGPPDPPSACMQRLVGKSEAMRRVHELVVRAAGTDLPVLIQGESGTGKELIARAIHEMSGRERNRFFSENCAAVPESLLETELFGHSKGSFTGATRDKSGILELATGGTLFLDEIGDMSLGMQAKLLRTLQEGEIRRVGGEEIIRVDVRIVSATNKVLEDCIRRGTFREDLYYRINVICIEVPPLRRRKEDIPCLVNHFFRAIERRNPGIPWTISTGALELLQKYHWPGNVRELQNAIERSVIMSDGHHINEEVLLKATDQIGPPNASRLSGAALKTGEQLLLEEILLLSSGDKTRAAHRIGWSRPKLYRKMRQYGLHRNFGKTLD